MDRIIRKIEKIIQMRNNAPNPIFRTCYLESEKKYKHIKDKDAYVAVVSRNNEKKSFNKFFVKGFPKNWDTNHKTYWMVFDFEVIIGDILEFRWSSKKITDYKYYIVCSDEKNNNLLEISKYIAIRIVVRYQKFMETQNYHLRTIPASVKSYVFQRDGERCVYCGSNVNLEYDHVIPFSWGGSNSPENVQLLCRTCNRRKSDSLTDGKMKSTYFKHIKRLDEKKFAS